MRSFARAKHPRSDLPAAMAAGARGRVLTVALKLFARQGFHGTSTRDLTTALEVQPSALYAHFASKDHVLAELVRGGYLLHHETLRAAVLDAGASPAAQLVALVKANARFHAQHALLATVVHEESHWLTEELSAAAVALRDQSVALLREVIERGVGMKLFKPVHLMATMAALGAMAIRIPYWFVPGEELDVDALAEAHAQMALRLLGVERP